MLRTAHIFIACIMLYAGFVFTACTTPEAETSRVAHTEGQALNDLKTARNRGAINHDEYEDAKEEILDRYED